MQYEGQFNPICHSWSGKHGAAHVSCDSLSQVAGYLSSCSNEASAGKLFFCRLFYSNITASNNWTQDELKRIWKEEVVT
jgi:hypothetical protein